MGREYSELWRYDCHDGRSEKPSIIMWEESGFVTYGDLNKLCIEPKKVLRALFIF